MSNSVLTLTSEFAAALSLMESAASPLFVTGKAGTGKSTLLTLFREQTTRQVAVVAPTGVAALNVGGQTIHSFFKLRPDTTPEQAGEMRLNTQQLRIYRALQTLVIDEISMVRADLLDCVDAFLRRHGPRRGQPFGGVQVIMVGDLYQLPPVVTQRDGDRFTREYDSPYFFSAKCLQELPLQTIELNQVFRQHDDDFIEVLNAVRENAVSGHHLDVLNSRYDSDAQWLNGDDVVITLTSTNDLADRVNDYQMRAIDTPAFTNAGRIWGTFGERDLPTQQALALKPGAQVMLLNNDPNGRWVNGSLGRIVDSYAYGDAKVAEPVILVELADGKQVEVAPFTWEQIIYTFNDAKGQLETQSVGGFTQFPLRLAWAVTIHKSQGKTFEKVVIDVGRGTFSHGQMYVALSRCTTLSGITLRQAVERRHVIVDPRVVQFMRGERQPVLPPQASLF